MAWNLLEVAQRVAFEVGVSNTFTSFSDNDDSNLIKYYVNKAYYSLYDRLPKNCIYFTGSKGTISTVAGTYLYNITPVQFNIDNWQWRITEGSNQVSKLDIYTKDNALDVYLDLANNQAKPSIVYPDSPTQVGFYPVPDQVYTIEYYYTPSVVETSATTDTFIFPDSWLRLYVIPHAAYLYLAAKDFEDKDRKQQEAVDGYGIINAECSLLNPYYMSD